MIERISQSFIKDFRAYLAGDECGQIIHARHVEQRILDLTEDDDPGAADHGVYFEFTLSGALPRGGGPPKIKILKNGRPDSNFRKAAEAAELVSGYLKKMNLKVIKVGARIVKGRHTGTIDLVVEYVGENPFAFDNGIVWNPGDRFVIDLKYSGLVGERGPRFNKHGWQWSAVQKEYHGTQAKQYHFLTGLPFYFLVTQSNNKEGEEPNVQLFYIPIDAQMIEDHLAEGNRLFDQFKVMAKIGFQPRPSLRKCNKCPLNNECVFKHTFPHPQIIYLNDY